MIDWNELNLGELEDDASVKVRLDEIHKHVLAEKNLALKPSKNSPGFAPSPYQSRQVSVMSALGLEAKDIALVLDIEESMLKTYYRKELRVSLNYANMMVARTALQMALSGRYPDMTKFWLTHKGKWKPAKDDPVADEKKGDDLDSAKDRLKRLVHQVNKSPA